MKHNDGFFKGPRDLNIYYQGWLPEGNPKAVLIVVHGLAEHSGRYMNLVNRFVPQGYAVYGIDHIGHGKSDGTRVYVECFEEFTGTLKTYLNMIKKLQPEKPIFLIGHSMGALISAVFLLDHQDGLTGAVLSGISAKVPDNIPQAVIIIGRIFSSLMPKFGLIALEKEAISRDPKVVKAYIADPLVCKEKTTARLAVELLRGMQRITAEAAKITLPVLIVHGSADRLVNPEGAQMLYEKVRSTDKSIQIYPGLYHEVFNEPEHEKVLLDVENWLEAHSVAGR